MVKDQIKNKIKTNKKRLKHLLRRELFINEQNKILNLENCRNQNIKKFWSSVKKYKKNNNIKNIIRNSGSRIDEFSDYSVYNWTMGR